ncbi:uncharacterized protein LOC110118716 [Ceratitis capitata]|uniref:uncharacterized protein LOC110118716 n=1 Tax=Ceratitis capitata TaxID=7213 RepID=UPI000A1108B1|nr:uncharacterized protein LOC110118716 [Ceratitis capitata]
MAKFLVLLIFTFCLALQLVKAFPQNVAEPEQSTDLEVNKDFGTELAKSTTTTVPATTDAVTDESTDSKQESDSDSTEDFSYPPLKYYIIKNRLTLFTLKVVQNHLNTILTVGHEYTTASLKALNEMPNKTSDIKANITHLNDLLARLEGLDLAKNNFDGFLDKIGLINGLK